MKTTDSARDVDLKLLRFVQAASHKLNHLSQHVHPQWLAKLPAPFGVLKSLVWPEALLQAALLEQFALALPDLSRLHHPLEGLWVLPRQEIEAVCLAQVIYVRRGGLSRCLDATLRRSFKALVPEAVFTRLMQVPFRPEQVMALEPVNARSLLLLKGFEALRDAFAGPDLRHWALIGMALPFAPSAAPSVAVKSISSFDQQEFLGLLLELFPEQAWLFGSMLDRSRSV